MKVILVISYLIGGLFNPILSEQAFATTAEQMPIPISKQAPAEILLTSVNGISLNDDVFAIIEKKGTPIQISTDPVFKDQVMYEYSDMLVSFRDDVIDYLEIGNGTETLYLDHTEIPATIEAVQTALGEPDYVAEDGLVFQRNEALLKLFINSDSGELESIAYYHIAST